MSFRLDEILETLSFSALSHFDIRTVTLGINIRDCHSSTPQDTAQRVKDKLLKSAEKLCHVVDQVSCKYNIPVANKRIAVSPISMLCESFGPEAPELIALAVDSAAKELNIDFIGGFSALIDKGITKGEQNLINALPQVLSNTERLCASFNIATSRTGLNLDAATILAQKILAIAEATKERDAIGCAKLVIFANAVEDNPFMAGAFHGASLGEFAVNVGISGPGVVAQVLKSAPADLPMEKVSELIRRTSFKMTKVGELFLRECSELLGYPAGIIDVSLAPTPTPGDSVGEILEEIGLEKVGTHGTVAALAVLNDAIKKGGMMATSNIGGMSGAFIPVSEDANMIEAAKIGALSFDKLETMTCVCSVGLDMVAIPGDTPFETIAAIIADECMLGVVNHKTTAVRIIPVPGKKAGDFAYFGGLLGQAPIMPVHTHSAAKLIRRGGRLPTPTQGLKN